MKSLTIVIPAYNEEATVGDVAAAVKNAPLVEEVLVVSDGSTDRTVQRAHMAGARVIELLARGGKGHAMCVGVEAAHTAFVMFLDADIYGITHEHVQKLFEPVERGQAVMSVGLRDRGALLVALMRLLPLVSGERCLSRTLFLSCPSGQLSGYRVEIALNALCREKGGRIQAILLTGVRIRTKVAKVGWRRGLWQYVRMWGQVAGALVASSWHKR
ncbi:glycosyltransferase [Candidatus Uhrbacteria bacterium]|nr:glycosyltransferase [Candidatus Uhrbacteria bacterium]